MERESRIQTVQQNLSQCTNKLAELQEGIDELGETLNSKTGNNENGDGAGTGTGVNNNIVRLKDGLKIMKNEIKQMSMAIILLNDNLLKERIQQSRGKLTANQRRAMRQNKSRNDRILSDDEVLD